MFAAPDTDTDPGADGSFKAPADDADPKTLAGFGSNLVQDVKGNVKGLADLAQGLSEHPIETAKGIPGALMGEGKRIGLGELLTGHPINAAEKFGNAAYTKPLSTLMDVAPVVGAAGKALGLGGAAAEGLEGAETAAKAAEAAGEASDVAPAAEAAAEEAPGVAPATPPPASEPFNPITDLPPTPPKEEPAAGEGAAPPTGGGQGGTPPSPPGGSFGDTAADALGKAKEVKDYISRGYEGYAKKPGAIADIADWVQEKSQMMAAQQLGVTPNQARQLARTPLESHNAMRAIGQYALDKDIVSPTTGLGGMLEKNAALQRSVGKTLGDFREMADKLNPDMDPKAVVAEVRKALDQKYMRTITTPEGEQSSARGAYGGQAGAYLRALQEVEDADKSHSGIAEAATELNHAANKAAKNLQPETPFTDVANEVSRINNEKIKALLGQDNAAKYEQALREYGVNKKIANALKFKSSGEVKRFGPGGFVSNMTQKLMDEAGYRLGSKVANKASTSILKNPHVAGNLPSLFKEFIHQVEDVGHDVTGMAHGGVVPKDVREYVNGRC